jgi:hypothetical protein
MLYPSLTEEFGKYDIRLIRIMVSSPFSAALIVIKKRTKMRLGLSARAGAGYAV